ncbi:MAG: type II secretion system F family protein [Gammaproteobacteria bacterium]
MNSLLLFSYGIAVGLVSCAVWVFQRSQRAQLREKVNRRLKGFADSQNGDSKRRRQFPLFMERLLRQAGIAWRDWHLPVAVFTLLTLLGIGWKWNRAEGLILLPACTLVLVFLWIYRKAQKRKALVLVQLPLFLDQVLRALGTGRSMDGALSLAASEAPDPLKEIIERVLRHTALGADLGTVLQETADLYRIKEWHLLALAVKINRSYGSGVRELLESVIDMIRQREAARRELNSLTGETRVSAWVLGLLPPGMAFYMSFTNPSYLTSMWHDPTGHTILLVAVICEAIGAFFLWCMIKSI